MTFCSDSEFGPELTQIFARFFYAYLQCDEEIKEIVRRQVGVIMGSDVDEGDKMLALSTVQEALFPGYSPTDGQLGFCLDKDLT